MANCKPGKEKNSKGRCVNKCTTTQRRNRAGKCVSLKRPMSVSIKSASSSHYVTPKSIKSSSSPKRTVYKKPLPINAAHFRGQLLTKKRHLKHHSPHASSSSSGYGRFKW